MEAVNPGVNTSNSIKNDEYQRNMTKAKTKSHSFCHNFSNSLETNYGTWLFLVALFFALFAMIFKFQRNCSLQNITQKLPVIKSIVQPATIHISNINSQSSLFYWCQFKLTSLPA